MARRADSAQANGDKIIELRQGKKGWTRKELSEVSGVPYGTIGRAEKNGWIRVTTLAEIAEALDAKSEDIIARSDTEDGRGVVLPFPSNVVRAEFQGDDSSCRLDLVPAKPSLIIGRDQILTGLRMTVQRNDRVIVQGWPGVGKSTIAVALAYDGSVRQRFSDGVLWVSLGPSPTVLSDLVLWGRTLGANDMLDMSSTKQASARLRSLLTKRRRLLIVDDVWEIEHAAPFLVGGPDCAEVVTTRLPEVAHTLAGSPGEVYPLPVLTTEDSVRLLMTLAPEAAARYPGETRELAGELEGLPLALQVAGRLLAAEAGLGWGVSSLLNEIRDESKILYARAPSDCVDLASQTAPSVAALLRRSTDHLRPTIRRCFAMLGAFAAKPASFDLEALSAVWGAEDPRPIVRELVGRGLLQPLGDSRFTMHALLASLATTLSQEEPDG